MSSSLPSAVFSPSHYEVRDSLKPLQPILHAMAQLLGCNSANLALIDDEKQVLVLAMGVTGRSIGTVAAVETVLGFSVSGLAVPLAVTESLIVRALREERILVTTDVRDIAGGALPAEIIGAVYELIGPRLLMAVPVLGRTRALGVLLLDRPDSSEPTAPERDLLLTYAERVGAELESQALSSAAQRLEQLGQVAVPPPTLLLCAETPPSADGRPDLIVVAGDGSSKVRGQPLTQALGYGNGRERDAGPLAVNEALWNAEIKRRLDAGESVTMSFTGERSMRLTLRTISLRLAEPGAPEGELAGPGAPLYLVAVEDLGWSQQLARETALAKERLAKVMRSIGDAILTLDASGTIQQCNDASQKVLGIASEVLCGMAGPDLAATPRARAALQALMLGLPRTGFAEVELRLLRARPGDAARRSRTRPQRAPSFPAQLSALLLCDENGAPAGAVWRIHDNTAYRRDAAERQQLRSRLVQSERLSALGEMSARIAHEVRNPLVSIGAAAQVIAEELGEASPVRAEALAIGSEVRRLDHILNNVLRFARPSRAAVQRTDVLEALRQVLELVRPKARGLTLKLSGSDGPIALGGAPGSVPATPPGPDGLPAPASRPIYALIDADQLKQVLWNVLLNACEAARPTKEADAEAQGAGQPLVECAVRRRRVTEPSRADAAHRTGTPTGIAPPGPLMRQVLITIADSGPGIPVTLRRRVFDPFFSTKARGTGLGLSISKQIIEEAGGRIRLLNRPSGGTRVVIELRATR